MQRRTTPSKKKRTQPQELITPPPSLPPPPPLPSAHKGVKPLAELASGHVCASRQALGDLVENVKGGGGCAGGHHTAFTCPFGGGGGQNSCCASGLGGNNFMRSQAMHSYGIYFYDHVHLDDGAGVSRASRGRCWGVTYISRTVLGCLN